MSSSGHVRPEDGQASATFNAQGTTITITVSNCSNPTVTVTLGQTAIQPSSNGPPTYTYSNLADGTYSASVACGNGQTFNSNLTIPGS
jgi:hypothetical protein